MNTTARARDRMATDTSTDETGPLTGWAATEAATLLVGLPKKWSHTREVAAHARWATAGVRPDDRDLLVAAAYLHDIGYAEPLVDTGFHPLDGARYLRRHGLGELACLVAHHTGAQIEAAHRGLTAELAEFPRPTGPVADALTYSDVTSGPTGQPMDPGERFEEIVDRHGQDSIVAQSRAQARVEMYGMVARTLRRTTRHHPPAGPLTVTPVNLSCTTLVRFQGELTGATAAHAAAVLRAVLNHRPHTVLVDLALLTGLDHTGARTLITASHDRIPVTLIDPRGRDRALLETVPATGWPPRIVYGIETALTPHCAT
jgi:HD domain